MYGLWSSAPRHIGCHDRLHILPHMLILDLILDVDLKVYAIKQQLDLSGEDNGTRQGRQHAQTQPEHRSKENKPKEAQPGHQGFGRKKIALSEADRIETVNPEVGNNCPYCSIPLTEKGFDERTVFDSRPVKAERIIYRLPKKYCKNCRRIFQSLTLEFFPRVFMVTKSGRTV